MSELNVAIQPCSGLTTIKTISKVMKKERRHVRDKVPCHQAPLSDPPSSCFWKTHPLWVSPLLWRDKSLTICKNDKGSWCCVFVLGGGVSCRGVVTALVCYCCFTGCWQSWTECLWAQREAPSRPDVHKNLKRVSRLRLSEGMQQSVLKNARNANSVRNKSAICVCLSAADS